jgi:hypothetical protein
MINSFYDFGHDWARKLRNRCEQKIPDILREVGGQVMQTTDGPLCWVRRGAPVLAVVHMDFVPVQHRWGYDHKRGRVWTPRLDDRMGLFVLLDVLPSLGINVDLLLTDSEEVGRSTARYFCDELESVGALATHGYNWCVQFDRRGDDVVLYDYEASAEWEAALSGHGFKVGCGSFSDISSLGDLGVCAVNIGCGYHHEHSTRCYGDIEQLTHNVALFESFYRDKSGVRFEYTEKMRDEYYSRSYGSYGSYGKGYQSIAWRYGDDMGYPVEGDGVERSLSHWREVEGGWENTKTGEFFRTPDRLGGDVPHDGDTDDVCVTCGEAKRWWDIDSTTGVCDDCYMVAEMEAEEREIAEREENDRLLLGFEDAPESDDSGADGFDGDSVNGDDDNGKS